MHGRTDYEFGDWENRIIDLANGAIECAIASAYITSSGVNLLSNIAKHLADTATSSQIKIRVILSDKFASTKDEQVRIIQNLSALSGVEVRVYHSDEFFHWKNYIFRADREIRVIVGSVNATTKGLFNNLELASVHFHDKQDPVVRKLLNEFDRMWQKSKTPKEYIEVLKVSDFPPKYREGQNVRYTGTGAIGTINKVIANTREYQYRVTLDGKPRTIPERYLEPYFDAEENIIDELANGTFGDHEDYQLFHTWFRLSKPIESNLYTYLGSKTIFNPHQFKPLRRFLSPGSDERLFIADEVGVGKTIETGIIIKELIARGDIDSSTPILIVCPKSLGPKWQKEMKERFMLNFYIHDGKSLRLTLNEVKQTGQLPKNYMFSIVGLELVRLEDYLVLINEIDLRRNDPLFGLLVIDESHHLRNPETLNNEVGRLLSSMSERVLMLSATPLNLRNEDLYNQMHILNQDAFPDSATFEALQSPVIRLNKVKRLIAKNTAQARKEILAVLADLATDPLGNVICRQPIVMQFIERLRDPRPFRVDEVVSYERQFTMLSPLYSSFTRTRKREALEHQVTREVLDVPIMLTEREMAFHNNVIKTLEDFYLADGNDPQMLGFLTNLYRRMISSSIPAMREYLEWSIRENRVVYDQGDSEDDSEVNTKQLDPVLREKFIYLIEEAKTLEGIDSKYGQFKKMLDNLMSEPGNRQVIVFSFFIRTLEYLKRRLEADGCRVGIMHGNIPLTGDGNIPDRYSIMEEFKKGSYDILLSSEVGEQGLDFQYCHVLINYDLPYNPMRIEQRIGRVDRFGQQADKIIVANLFLKDTVDEEIYDRLYKRIHIVEDGIGAMEPILGKELSDLQSSIITGKLTDEQREERTLRLEKMVIEAKEENEEFEKSRRDLIGDDYLVKPINSIGGDGFLSPEDAIQLTKYYLSMWKGCEFKDQTKETYLLQLSPEIKNRLEQFLRKKGNESGYGELDGILADKTLCVFDGSIANNYPDHVFLSPTGYWSKFLTYELEQTQLLKKVFKFTVKNEGVNLSPGRYLVFLFEIKMEGVRKEIDFYGIPVNVDEQAPVKIDYNKLPRLLSKLDADPYDGQLPDIDVNLYLDMAREYVSNELEGRVNAVAKENRFIVESRIEALKKASEIRIKNLQRRIENYETKKQQDGSDISAFYLRATSGSIEKERIRIESKIKELEARQELTVDYDLDGIIYTEVLK